ncbi:MAG: hypothetical protein JXR80_01965 [Deltaproteobacteria bacterium]|nr:hypothetical protein [Deltaproteobacteria bacterium]
MKCPKCGYTSFDYLRQCKKCGESLDESRQALNLKMGEPTLFAGLKDEPAKKTALTQKSSHPSNPATVSPPDTSTLLTKSSALTSAVEPASAKNGEAAVSGLGLLGNMESIQPRPNRKSGIDDLPNIELGESIAELDGLELTPDFNADSKSAKAPENQEKNKSKFELFEVDEIAEIVAPRKENILQEDIPFEFSASNLEEMNLPSSGSELNDKDLIELELDMEDDESLDQILADLQARE